MLVELVLEFGVRMSCSGGHESATVGRGEGPEFGHQERNSLLGMVYLK